MKLRSFAFLASTLAFAGGLSVFGYLRETGLWGGSSGADSVTKLTNPTNPTSRTSPATIDAPGRAAAALPTGEDTGDHKVQASKHLQHAPGTRSPTGTAVTAGTHSGPATAGAKTKTVTADSHPQAIGSSHSNAADDASHEDDTPETWVDWTKPTGGLYPDLSKYHDIWVEVSISKQRTYIHAGNQIIYTMIVSTGNDDDPSTATPTGTFEIEPEQGDWFYNPTYEEGAEYWVSFLNHGEYLFHSVPMDMHHHVIRSVAEDLGRENSHGCVHLSIPDAKWFYDNIPTGTRVVIHE
ncbi:MAG: L,D-transpeptidase family protein [Alicyclobacillus sp.]|nr:L,D-transpeptidase family protein [Alicyclobacillus sp.]